MSLLINIPLLKKSHLNTKYYLKLSSVRQTRRFAVQVGTWIIMAIVIVAVFEESHKKQQMGLFFSLGALSSFIAMRPYIIFPEEDKDRTRMIIRLIIGVIPILLMGYAIFLCHKRGVAYLEQIVFAIGCSLGVWVCILAPWLFVKFSLMKIKK